MKASYHNSRKYNNPRHNDRRFDVDKAEHIRKDAMHMNRYSCVYKGMDFESAEVRFYKETFSKYIKQRKELAKKHRHPEREITSEDLRRDIRTRPEETIIQIGDYDETISDYRILLRIFDELQVYSDKVTRGHCKVIDAALHMDEATPHIHFRKVWVYEEDGIKKIGQEKALKSAGIERPYPERPQSRRNNRKVTYDRMMREKLYELCFEHGIKIDIIPDPPRPELSKDDYILWQMEKEKRRIRELERKEREREERERRKRKDNDDRDHRRS